MGTVFGRGWIGMGNEDGSRQPDQKGHVRRTWGGRYQAYDNQGRKLGRRQKTEFNAANAGSNELRRPTAKPKKGGLW